MAVYNVNGSPISTTITSGIVDIRKNGFLRSIAHRGYSDTAPENTLPAFRLAKVNGFDAVEMDIKWTSDGIPIILHDFSIARTARNADGSAVDSSIGNANVSTLPLGTLRNYDYGIWKSSEYAGTDIPTFEEALQLCKNIQLHPYIEIGSESSTRAATLVSIVESMGMLRNVTWASKVTGGLLNIQSQDEYARLDYFVNSLSSDVISTANALVNGASPVVIGTGLNDSSALIKATIEAGFDIECGLISTTAQALAINPAMVGAMSNSINTRQILYEANIT